MNARFLIFLSLLGGVTLYVVWRVSAYAASPYLHPGAVFGLAAAILLVLVLPLTTEIFVPAAYRVPGRYVIRLASWTVLSFQGVFLCLIFYTLAVDLGGLVWRAASDVPDPVIDHMLFLALAGLTGVTSVVGLLQGALPPKLTRVEIPIDNLPPALDGFSIAQISDLHVGPLIGARQVARIVKRINALKPDVVILTGDSVDGEVEHLRPDVAPLSHLRPREAVFFIIGNHECYWNARAWTAHFEKLGAIALWNNHAVIHRGKDKVAVAGVTDWSTRGRAAPDGFDPASARRGIPEDAVKILLAHQPNGFDDAEKLGFDVQFSGHTHGGQFFPWSLVVRFFHRYYTGLHRHGRMWIYVSRGTGFWGPPLRAGVPAEITLATLRKA
jgi:predicted MPP superfamily phosphohydrolase